MGSKYIEQKYYTEKITTKFWNTEKTIFFNSKTHSTHEREREREREQ